MTVVAPADNGSSRLGLVAWGDCREQSRRTAKGDEVEVGIEERRFTLPVSFTREELLGEADALAGTWIAICLGFQPDEALLDAIEFAAERVSLNQPLWHALEVAFVYAYRETTPQIIAIAREIDPRTAA